MNIKNQNIKNIEFLERIEGMLRFSLSEKLIIQILNDFQWLKGELNLIDLSTYNKSKVANYSNLKYQIKIPKVKKPNITPTKNIINIAKQNTTNDGFITYPKK